MEKQQQSTHLPMSGAHLVEELRIDEHEEPLVHCEPDYVWATAGVVFALSIGYWLMDKKS